MAGKAVAPLPDKEVLEMRSLLVPGLLAAVAVAQSVRIEQVFAAPPRAEPAGSPASRITSSPPMCC